MRKLEKLGTWSRSFLLLSILCFVAICAQAQKVTGVVKDQNGDAVIGATVKLVGSKTGTVTDAKGHYEISAPNGSILSVSYVGYLTKQMRLRGENVVDIILQEDNTTLNDLVVVGYGVQKKSDLTGAVASVKAEELKGLSTTDAAAALQGKASGVHVLNSSGKPGAGAKVRVRGYSSNSEDIDPLYIVDGLQVKSIQYLDPSMIESMEVLKDAASAAIYGAEAGNGVILITTKSGAKGTGTINYTAKFTNQMLGNVPTLLNASEFKDWMIMQKGSGDLTSKMEQYQKDYGWDPNTDTDWLKEYFEDTWAQQHTITFQGANDRGSYFLSTSYVKQDGIIKGNKDNYERLTAQINADYQIKDWLKVGTNTSIEKWASRGVSENGYGTAFEMLLLMDPLTPVYWTQPSQMLETYRDLYLDPNNGFALFGDENGQYATSYFNQRLAGGSPFSQRDRAGQKNDGVNVNGTAFLNVSPFKSLTFTSRLGYRLSFQNSSNYETPYYLNAQSGKVTNYNISGRADNNTFYQWENFVNWNETFGKHNLGAMAGFSFRQSNSNFVSANASGPDILKAYDSNFIYLDCVNGNSDTTKGIGGVSNMTRSMSYFGRINYSFDDRYSLQGNIRRDAFSSEKLSADKRWGTFFSASAGWTFSNEAFFKNSVDSKIMSFGKIRASWGQNGNVKVLNNYAYTAGIATNSQWYQYGSTNAAAYGSMPNGIANPDLTWETSEQIDLGADFRFLNSRLALGIDWYKKTTKDLLVPVPAMPESGVSTITMNAGEVENSGLEIELSWKDNIGDFKYGISANMATLSNKATYLTPDLNRVQGGTVDGASPGAITCYFEQGHSMWYMRGYKYLGTETKEVDGKMKNLPVYEHKNADGTLGTTNDPMDADLTDIGSGLPTLTYGVTLNAEYKGIDLTIFGTGAAGNDVYYGLYREGYSNVAKGIYDDFKSGKFPDADVVDGVAKFYKSSAMVYDGSYFKIKQIQLGYTLPKSVTKKIFMENVRAYISLDDFFTFTSYPGLDPETTTQNYNCPGLDKGAYPSMKKMVLGLSVTF
ncbi:MAG: TonB-dependent receptor [Prevotellaceae bacterium]|nr:TonB-dependent receptor [Prevotellaceae bacterium]